MNGISLRILWGLGWREASVGEREECVCVGYQGLKARTDRSKLHSCQFTRPIEGGKKRKAASPWRCLLKAVYY